MIEGSSLLGPQAAMQRMTELQQRIQSFQPPSAPVSFSSALTGCLAAADPGQFDVQSLKGMAAKAAQNNGVDPAVFQSLIHTESGWNPSAQSSKGALGLSQLMPSTAAGLGVSNPLDPSQSLEGGAKYLRQMLDKFGNDYTKAVAAYNAGPGAVEKANGIPPYQETISYVRKVLGGLSGSS